MLVTYLYTQCSYFYIFFQLLKWNYKPEGNTFLFLYHQMHIMEMLLTKRTFVISYVIIKKQMESDYVVLVPLTVLKQINVHLYSLSFD